jgi:hypothetical protein
MINLLITNLMLIFSIIYIVDYSGIIFDISKFIYERTNKDKIWQGQIIGKPFGCSLCLSFWTSLIICLFNTTIVFALFIATCFAILSILIKKLLGKIINLINKI